MRVVVFGASGRVGTKVVQLLLANPQNVVVALVHSHNRFEHHDQLTVIQLDVHDQAAVRTTLQGADAVISCVSNWGSESGDVLTAAMRAIVPVMQELGIRRIVSLTGNAAFTPDDVPTAFQKANRAMLQRVAPKVLVDGEEHMKVLRESELDWTVIRSPVMNELGSTRYRLLRKLSGATATIHRQAVARAMVDQLQDGTWLRQAPVIWRA